MKIRWWLLVVSLLMAVGCEGSLDTNNDVFDVNEEPNNQNNQNNVNNINNLNNINNINNVNNSNNVNVNNSNNLNNNDDMGSDPCANVTCGANAMCDAGMCMCLTGFIGDANAGCTPADPCASVTCPYGATCSGGVCACDAGFNDDGNGGCTQVTPGDTANRTRMEVCTKWSTDVALQASETWQVEPVDMCDPGVMHPDRQTDALRRASLYRWLVGLPAVTSDASRVQMVQECATTLAAQNSGLTHNIPDTYACYTQLAAQGAGSSNLAQGVTNPAGTVDLYVGDRGVASLGHRRWVLNPGMGRTAFGHRGRYSCMYAFDRSGSANPDYVAYPAPGFFPNQALSGQWSFGSTKYGFNAQTTVTITKVSDGTPLTVSNVNVPGGGYGIQVVAWTVSGLEMDVEYEITVDGLTGNLGSTVTYRTTITNC